MINCQINGIDGVDISGPEGAPGWPGSLFTQGGLGPTHFSPCSLFLSQPPNSCLIPDVAASPFAPVLSPFFLWSP